MALTVAELAARPDQQVAYLLTIDGVRYAWTDTVDLVGSGAGSWIGTDYGDREVLLGHGQREDDPLVPETLDTGVDLDTGRVSAGDAVFNLTDRDGVLIEFVREPDRDFLATRVGPKDDPAPANPLGPGGDPVSLWGRCIGAETIGPAGERHMFPCIPGMAAVGLDHAAIDNTEQSIAYSEVTDAPQLLQGRRVCLYLLRRDPTTGATGPAAWPSWGDQVDSGVSLIWWGSLDKLEATGHVYRVRCSGPDAWLRKTLNQNSPADWRPVSTKVSLSTEPGQRQDLIAVGLEYISWTPAETDKRCGFSLFDPADDVLSSDVDADVLRSEIAARIAALVAAAGPDETFSTYRNGAISFTLAGVTIRVDAPEAGAALGGKLALCMHERVWRALGWDPIVQGCTYEEIETTRDVRVLAIEDTFQVWDGASASAPGPGYYVFYFNTLPFGTNYTTASVDIDNGGKTRVFEPLSEAGVVMLQPEGQQEVSLAFGTGGPYCEGQLARPVANHVLRNGNPCDTTGFLCFRAPYRESIEEEARDRYAVAKVSWQNDGGTFAQDDTAYRTAFIERWLDPRLFGFSDSPFTLTWASNQLEWCSLAVLGYNTNAPDRAHLALLRMLLSTGSKAWDAGSYEGEPGATYVPGLNGHPDAAAPDLQGDDQDVADLGLAVPAELVDWASFPAAAEALPAGGADSPLNLVKLAFRGPFDSQTLLEQVMKPRSWFMGLAGYRYSLWSMAAPLDADDATVTLSQADLDSDVGGGPYVPTVDLAPLLGFDRGSIEYHYPAADEGGETATLAVRPLSARARARAGNAEVTFEGRGLLDVSRWVGDLENEAPPSWTSAFRQLWEQFLADYLLQPHVMIVGYPVKAPKANLLNPGTVVLVTDPWPPGRAGTYGLNAAVGRVVSVKRNTRSLTATCDILIQAGDANSKRRFAPVTAVVDDAGELEDRINAATRTLYCQADPFGAGGGSSVKWFVPPSWSTLTGDALVHGYQFDGRGWTKRFEFEVEAVDTTAHTITWKDGTWDGVFREREYTILMMAAHADQPAAWVKALMLVNTDPSGKFGGVKGFELVK